MQLTVFLEKGYLCQKPLKNEVEQQDNLSYQSLINHHPDTFFAMDIAGNILSCNNNVEGVLGYTSTELFGPFHRVIKEEELSRSCSLF